ncbi:MAG: ABC transporter ATP-binding protein, partial [Clostridia bacterium]|nr:ABC transporter ATP-binding protein [Clostridia bacterium]
MKHGPQSLRMLKTKLRDGTLHELFDDWKWILRYTAQYRGRIVLYTVLGIVSSTLGLAGSVAGKYLIDIITGMQTDRLVLLGCFMIGTALASLVIGCIADRLSARLTADIGNDVQADLFARVLDADWLSVSRYASGDLVSRFTQDAAAVAGNAVGWIPRAVIAAYQFAATFVVILYYDPIMALFALGTAPVLLLLSRRVIREQRARGAEVRDAAGELSAYAVETFGGIDTVKSFGIMDLCGSRLHRIQQNYREKTLAHQWFSMKTGSVLQLCGMAVQYAAFGYCLWRLWSGDITFGTMTLFLQQRSNLTGAFNALVGMVPAFLSASVAAHRICECIGLPEERHAGLPAASVPTGGISVCMDGVQFAYEEGRDVLRGSGMEAHPGEIVALVGTSGEGKTTLLRLMLGLIVPTEGTVMLRGSDGTVYDVSADTRTLFSYVPQGNTVFSGTIADNLRMVKPDADNAALIAALDAACAWEFVSRMPQGLETEIGERGKGLSEGQA